MAGASQIARWTPRRTRLMNAVHARLAAIGRPVATIAAQPEPRSIGRVARGRQLADGRFRLAGHLITAPGRSIWGLAPPDPAFAAEAHGFGWLDDLAAVPDADARALAQEWTHAWVARFGAGRGPGWAADLTGRRTIRMLHHAIMLLHGQNAATVARFHRSLGRQALFLSRRWQTAAPGLPRFEALTGLLYAGLSLKGMAGHAATARAALERECPAQIDAEGGIATRNPEELLEIFTLLTWAAQAMAEAGAPVGRGLLATVERVAPTLRRLRHADGSLARFHGGGRGADGQLDHALAASGVRAAVRSGMAMGFARLQGGRTTVIADVSAPPARPVSHNAHASTLAFELTSGRRPVIVNCGPGEDFGAEWRRAGRATACHSTAEVEGWSSARLSTRGGWVRPGHELLVSAPVVMKPQLGAAADGTRLLSGHDGYAASHGLTHMRRLHLSASGRVLSGEDMLGAMDESERRSFDRVLARARQHGVTVSVRFHLHPDVDAMPDMGGSAVSMQLRSGEVWLFRHDGQADMTLEPSVYLQSGHLKPRSTTQVVLSARITDYAAQIGWTLAKAQETPDYLRDIETDEIPASV